jgi:APA family basic amino acid/polyamine antiporter
LPESKSRSPAGDAALLRVVGFWALAASIVNVTIGASIFAMPGTLAASMGAAAPLAFLLGGVLFVPIVLCFAAAGSRVTATGGPYSYVDAAFGRFPGFAIATFFWISNVAGSGSLSSALADQVAHLLPWMAQPVPRAAFLLAEYAGLVALNAWGVRIGAGAIVAFAAAKVIPLLLIAIVGARYVHIENLRVHDAPSWAAIGSSLVLVVFAYSGIETALAPSGEVRNPTIVIPKAALAGVAVVIALYVAIQVVAQGVLGAALVGNDAPLATVADLIIPVGGSLMVATAAVSLIGCLQGELLGSSRLLYALARDGFLPAPLAAVTEKHRVPVRAIIAHAAAAWILASFGSFAALALVSGGAFCIVYIGVCAAASRLQAVDAGRTASTFLLRGRRLIPGIGIAGLLLILATLQAGEWIAIGCTACAVGAVYATTRWLSSR